MLSKSWDFSLPFWKVTLGSIARQKNPGSVGELAKGLHFLHNTSEFLGTLREFDIFLIILAFFDTVDPWQCMNGFLYCRYDLTQKDHINFASTFNRCWLGNHSLHIFMIMSLFMCILLVPTSQSESILVYLDWNKMNWYTYIYICIIYSSQELIQEIYLFHDWIFNSVNILIDIFFQSLAGIVLQKNKGNNRKIW